MTAKKRSKIAHPHDHAFRNAMSDLRVATDFLRHHLPADIQEKIDLSTLRLEKESYVDECLNLFMTDVLYSVALKDKTEKKRKVYLYLLLEHLSSPHKLTPWHMLEYTVQIIEEKRVGDVLPLVIPIVVYNGEKPYPYSTSIYDLFKEEEKTLAKDYMFTQVQLIDLTQVSDEEIQSHRWSGLMEILLKHACSRDIMNALESLKNVLSEVARQVDADRYISGMITYAVDRTDEIDQKRLKQFLHDCLSKELEEKTMGTIADMYREEGRQQERKAMHTIADVYREEGYKKGVEEAQKAMMAIVDKYRQEAVKKNQFDMAKKLLNKKYDVAFISQLTGLSLEEIDSLKETDATTS